MRLGKQNPLRLWPLECHQPHKGATVTHTGHQQLIERKCEREKRESEPRSSLRAACWWGLRACEQVHLAGLRQA